MLNRIIDRYLKEKNIELTPEQYKKVVREVQNVEGGYTIDSVMTTVASVVDTAFNKTLRPSDYYMNKHMTKEDVLKEGDMDCPKCKQRMSVVSIANDYPANYCFSCRITLPKRS